MRVGSLLATVLLAALSLGAEPPAVAPHGVVGPVGVGEARWTTGFWADRFATCRDETVPAMGRLMEGTDRSQFLENFLVASGKKQGKHRGPAWNDGDYYKWLEAAAHLYAVTGDPALDRRMDLAIAAIAEAQREDGYLHTPVLIANRNGDGSVKPFQDRLNFEMYNFGHLFTAACAHFRATGKRNLLDVAIKGADFLCEAFAKPDPSLARNSVCPSHYMGTVELYRVTGKKQYLDLAVKFLAMRDLVTDGTDDNQDRLPFRQQTEAAGHAVRANYLYAGAADLYLETGSAEHVLPLQKIWTNVVTRKMYLTGACGALYDGASPDGSKDQKRIARVHQSYGRDYQLPNSTAHNETCAAIGNYLWNQRMLQITGEAKYADVMETTLHNAVLAGVSLDGQRFFYTNTLRQLDAMPAPLRWSRSREEWISCYCCPPNVARIVAQVNAHAYGRSDRGVWVHLYGGSVLDTSLPGGGRIKLKQETDYPWEGRVKVTVEAAPSGETSLFLRVPGWADGAKLTVGGKTSPVTRGKYAEVRRAWKAGEVIELDLPMSPKLVEAHPLVEEARNQVAVVRGPLVYCLESVDLPKGVSLQSVAISRDVRLAVQFDPKFLGGVTVIEGQAERKTDENWDGELYREARPAKRERIEAKLIPYFAWSNRGRSEMTVWIPWGN